MDKLELMLKLSTLVEAEHIKAHVNEIYDIRMELEAGDHLTDEERIHITSKIKAKIQREANEAIDKVGGIGAVYAATGVGKSKIAIDRTKGIISKIDGRDPAILIVVPTEKLRDEGWHEEFLKWDSEEDYNMIERTCYASLDNYRNQEWDLVILDEGHNITENNARFFFENNNKIKELVALTATKPTDLVKTDILRRLGIKAVYTVSLDEAVRLGIVAPYDITVITVPIDKRDKYIRGGRSPRYFYQTEEKRYEYLSLCVENSTNPMTRINRMRFIYDLRSKTLAAKKLLDEIVPEYIKTLIFCGTKAQANYVCEHRYYSRPSKARPPISTAPDWQRERHEEKMAKYEMELMDYQGDESLNQFREGEIDRLACVDALNEGHNIAEDLDCAFIVQLDSKPLNFIQRIGRVLRFRPNHVGRIIILCAEETVDREWVNKAMSGLSMANIKWMSLAEVLSGEKQIRFSSSR